MKEGSLAHKVTLAIVPRLTAWLIRAWFSTCRIREFGLEHRTACREYDNPVIVSFWHYSILYAFYHMRHESAVAMVSASKDGEYIARLAAQFGFASVRGSRNRRGLQAMKELIRHLDEGRHVALVADGSQGPALKVQPGAVLLASKSGSPILPITWSASHYWTAPSWDRLVIPKPFSRIDFYYGQPVFVPDGLKAEGLEEFRLQLEDNLNAVYNTAWGALGLQQH